MSYMFFAGWLEEVDGKFYVNGINAGLFKVVETESGYDVHAFNGGELSEGESATTLEIDLSDVLGFDTHLMGSFPSVEYAREFIADKSIEYDDPEDVRGLGIPDDAHAA